jgi:hypothetical protein
MLGHNCKHKFDPIGNYLNFRAKWFHWTDSRKLKTDRQTEYDEIIHQVSIKRTAASLPCPFSDPRITDPQNVEIQIVEMKM